MKKIIATVLAGFLLMVLGATGAQAGGSDAPTPYDVTTHGLYLPEGETFKAHGHVNVRYVKDGENYERSANIHFDPNNGHPGGQWIGENFIPWDAFGIHEGDQITWVQVHGYNEHYGEGGQKWTPVGPKPEPGYETRERVEEGEWELVELICEAGEAHLQRTVWTYADYRESTVYWDRSAHWWAEEWTDWIQVEGTDVVETRTEFFDPNEEPMCEALPPTGAAGILGAAVVALLLGVGGVWAVRKGSKA